MAAHPKNKLNPLVIAVKPIARIIDHARRVNQTGVAVGIHQRCRIVCGKGALSADARVNHKSFARPFLFTERQRVVSIFGTPVVSANVPKRNKKTVSVMRSTPSYVLPRGQQSGGTRASLITIEEKKVRV